MQAVLSTSLSRVHTEQNFDVFQMDLSFDGNKEIVQILIGYFVLFGE